MKCALIISLLVYGCFADPSFVVVSHTDQLTRLIAEKHDMRIAALFCPDSADQEERYERVAQVLKKFMRMILVRDKNVCEDYHFEPGTLAVLQQKHMRNDVEPDQLVYSGPAQAQEYLNFLSKHHMGWADQMTSSNSNILTKSDSLVAYFDVNFHISHRKETNFWRNILLQIAKKRKRLPEHLYSKNIKFAVANKTQFPDHMKLLKYELDGSDIRVVLWGKNGTKYRYQGEFEESDLEEFLQKYEDGKLKSYTLSEPKSKSSKKGVVQTAIGQDLSDRVFMKNKDVVLLVYTTFTKPAVQNRFTEMAIDLKGKKTKNIVFMKINQLKNEVGTTHFHTNGVHSCLFFIPRNSEAITSYTSLDQDNHEGTLSEHSMAKWVKEQRKRAALDRKNNAGKKESKTKPEDTLNVTPKKANKPSNV